MRLTWVIALSLALLLHAGVAAIVASTYAPLQPYVECVEVRPDGARIVHLGYWNRESEPIDIPPGPSNVLHGASSGVQLPTRFAPGRSPTYPKAVVTVRWTGSDVVWLLAGREARATEDSPLCKPPKAQRALPEPDLQKIKPVAPPPAPEPPKPPPPKEPPPKAEKDQEQVQPARKKRPRRRRKRKRKKRPKAPKTQAPLVLRNAGFTGRVSVRRGRDDTLGRPSSRRVDPAPTPAPTPTVKPTGPPAGKKRRAPKLVAPRVIKSFPGRFPAGAQRSGRVVKVRLRVYVSKTGRVTKVRVMRGGGKLFDREARRVGFKLRFKPATLDGKRRGMWVPWTVEFRPRR